MTPLTPMHRSSKQKINKEIQVLNDTLDEIDLIDIFRTFHPNAEKYTFFSGAHGTFFVIDHILGHKILQAKLQHYVNHEFPDVQAGFRKGRGTRDQIANIAGSSKKQESSRKTSISALLTMPKPLTVWITINCGKF